MASLLVAEALVGQRMVVQARQALQVAMASLAWVGVEAAVRIQVQAVLVAQVELPQEVEEAGVAHQLAALVAQVATELAMYGVTKLKP